MAALPPAEGVPGGDAGLGLPGVLGLDDLRNAKYKIRLTIARNAESRTTEY